jgi:cellulose synthase/poly-beta-1,6-N-acetylglucosamine synthase-like glycosyltransferase
MEEMDRSYILVTVAYNEENRIEPVIKSVLAQSLRPRLWFIVSDGSTDRTDTIIREYAAEYEFIRYLRQEKRAIDAGRLEKVTIAQARAMALALEASSDIEYSYFGNLDADITLEADYYEKVIFEFSKDPGLGLAGGGVYNMNPDGSPSGGGFNRPYFVGGPVQLFRRKCIEDIGGYAPYGHSDCIADAKSRMKGWKVQCFPEIHAFHHEVPDNSIRAKVPVCFRMGQMDYIMGGLFIFQVARCTARMFKRPFLVAGMAMFAGFIWAYIKREEIRIPKDVIAFMQAEQKGKLLSKVLFRRTT